MGNKQGEMETMAILLLSWKHGGIICITGIPSLRVISFLEGIGKVTRMGELPSVKKWIDCKELIWKIFRDRLRDSRLRLGMSLIRDRWCLESAMGHLIKRSLLMRPCFSCKRYCTHSSNPDRGFQPPWYLLGKHGELQVIQEFPGVHW